MLRRFTKKRTIVALSVVAVLVGAGAAVAYFTASGGGTGSASVGSSSSIGLSSSAVSGLFPGGADVPVTVHVHNGGSGNQNVGTISGSISDTTTSGGTCKGSWFQVDPVAYNTTVDAGATADVSTKVRMLDDGTNQDACQGANLTINWSSN
jgi:hypothetical protein